MADLTRVEVIRERMQAAAQVYKMMLSDSDLVEHIDVAVKICIETLTRGGRILLCGNGGSAADAQHIAAELSGRFYKDRDPLSAEALHVNSSYLTAVANDYGFEEIYARQVKGQGRSGDVLMALSTSGNSENVCKAVDMANSMGMTTIGLTGESGGRLRKMCKITLRTPSNDTPRIQEGHILIGHILCELIESTLFE